MYIYQQNGRNIFNSPNLYLVRNISNLYYQPSPLITFNKLYNIESTSPINGSILFVGGQGINISPGITLTEGNFTIEWWQRWTIAPPTPGDDGTAIFSGLPSDAPLNQMYLRQVSPNQWKFKITGIVDYTINFLTNQSPDVWYHMVFTINVSKSFTMFQNGVKSISGSQIYGDSGTGPTSDFLKSPVTNIIGPLFQGFISNFRVITGRVIYPPALASITVPTATLNAVSGTIFLLTKNILLDDTGLNVLTGVDEPIGSPIYPF